MRYKETNMKKMIVFTECLCCLLLACLAVILINLKILKNTNSTASADVITEEISKVNTIEVQKAQTTGKARVENVKLTKDTYYVKVNYANQLVTVYTTDEEGQYSVPVKTMICSTGRATPTSGIYKISDKYTWRKLVGNVYGQYASRITGSILFHSVPYTKMDKSSLEYWEYEKLGTPASKGCVRLTVEDAKWIYDNCLPGTRVEFYEDSDEIIPVTLNEQTLNSLSEYDDELRCWDPTDPDEDNPWIEYLKQDEGKRN